MAKNQSPPGVPSPQGGVIHQVKNPFTPETLAALEQVTRDLTPANEFERLLAKGGIEASARKILDDAGLPYDRDIVETSGFPEGSEEWNASEILRLVTVARGFVRLGRADYAAIYAMNLGARLEGGDRWFNEVLPQRKKGGAKKKYNPVIRRFVESRLRKGRLLTAAAIWKMIPRDECDGVKIGQAKIYVDEDILRVTEIRNGNWEITGELAYPSFRKYVKDARKALAR